ncbi:MAG: hypothetical protein KDA84_15660 [Planctomycetaceae bacterium]|nr:hypothetical protein [Planctomycetaceae bacterium]
MDNFDRHHFATVYRSLAQILERDRTGDNMEDHLSFLLGNLTRRIFVGTKFLPPDELLEEVVTLLRTGHADQLRQMAEKLNDHAQHLEELAEESPET